jgi:hypothetical protein
MVLGHIHILMYGFYGNKDDDDDDDDDLNIASGSL